MGIDRNPKAVRLERRMRKVHRFQPDLAAVNSFHAQKFFRIALPWPRQQISDRCVYVIQEDQVTLRVSEKQMHKGGLGRGFDRNREKIFATIRESRLVSRIGARPQ